MKYLKKLASLLSIISMLQVTFLTSSYAVDQTISTKLYEVAPFSIDCPSAIAIDAKTGTILYEKNKEEKRYPASTTKMMTAILAIENCTLTQEATINPSTISDIPVEYQNTYLTKSSYTIEELLNMLLVCSSNIAGYTLAEHISGSIDVFADKMNQKAQELGCTNTHFMNPSGIQHQDHYSSAQDLAIIAQYAMKNQTFRKLVAQPYYTVITEQQKVLNPSTNSLLNKESPYYYPDAIGVKTGYTKFAGNCLVSAANKDGNEVICVVLGGNIDETENSQRYRDTIHLLDYCFEQYETKQILEKGSVVKETIVPNGTKETRKLSIVSTKEISTTFIKGHESTEISPDIQISKVLLAPIQAGEKLGSISYTIDGTVYSSDLIAENTVEQLDQTSIVLKICLITGALIAFVILLYLLFPKKKKERQDTENDQTDEDKQDKQNSEDEENIDL